LAGLAFQFAGIPPSLIAFFSSPYCNPMESEMLPID
jgi:hypothetical protein